MDMPLDACFYRVSIPGGDSTTLTVGVEYNIPVPVLGRMAERFLLKRDARDLEQSLTNAKEMLEA
jgi:uncharacterized membrane protein